MPVWTPDGTRIAFHSRGEGRGSVWWRAADGSGDAEELTTAVHPNSAPFPMSWSPDGKVLVLSEWQHATLSSDIWLLSLEGERKPRLFHGTPEFDERHPMFSPDGRWIAFTSNQTGRDEIYAKAYPASGGLIPISTNGGSEPVWSRNGDELFYRNGEKMMVVTVETAPTFKPSTPRMLFEAAYSYVIGTRIRSYDVSPDGRRFLMVQPEQASVTQLNVVINWFEELKQLVPTGN